MSRTYIPAGIHQLFCTGEIKNLSADSPEENSLNLYRSYFTAPDHRSQINGNTNFGQI